MTATTAAAAAPAAEPGYRDAVVMFGAHWCAPCMSEVRRLPDIAAAVAPDRVLLAWTDRPVAIPALTGLAALPPESARRLALSLAGEGYGLPFSVMFDPHGNACAVWRSPLRPADIPRLRAMCQP